MCKIIGIYGHRGAGRKTAGWLLAQTLEEIRKGTDFEKYQILFECWSKLVIKDPDEACSTNHCILDSFGEYILDSIKCMIGTLRDVNMSDPETIENIYISPKTFEWHKGNRAMDTSMDSWVYHFKGNHGVNDNVCVPLSEFIIYFADTIMKGSFGENFWVRSAMSTMIDSSDVRIFWDCKTDAELDACDVRVRVSSPSRKKKGGYRHIKIDDPDYVLDTHKNLEGDAEQFWQVAQDIYSKFYKK